ncbi:hypothetical protein OUZ56_005630 [Daphnia magna]|uniref:Uncharacterized protein n=1 Tax=Daphnia magna TaxID=35525 RepID=A0ABQ9YTE5_9CRUS|nr:hypothetical protein OUZ56_005630 [Daphnia magna]
MVRDIEAAERHIVNSIGKFLSFGRSRTVLETLQKRRTLQWFTYETYSTHASCCMGKRIILKYWITRGYAVGKLDCNLGPFFTF